MSWPCLVAPAELRINQNPDALLASGAAAGVAAGVDLSESTWMALKTFQLASRFQCSHRGHLLCIRGPALVYTSKTEHST